MSSSAQEETLVHFDWKKESRVIQCVELGSLAVKRHFIQVKFFHTDGESLHWIECYNDDSACPLFKSRKTCIQRLGDWWWVPGYFTYDLQQVKDCPFDVVDRVTGYCGPK